MQDFISLFPTFETNKIIFLHIFISFIISIASTYLLKNRYYNQKVYSIFLILFSFNIFLPVISNLITIFISIVLVNTKNKKHLQHVKKFNKGEFLNNNFPIVNRVFGEATVAKISTNTHINSNQKMKSLIFLSNNPDKKSFPIIKNLFSDKDNEIRLFSFSLLNSSENELNEKITFAIKEFNCEEDEKKRSKLAGELAHLYWDFIYYGFSNLETEGLIIKNTEYYLNIALNNEEKECEQNLLFGKVLLYKKDYESAVKSFKLAIKNGIKKSVVNFYLAEIAYEKRAYLEVKSLLKEIKSIDTSLTTAPIHKQWV